MARNNPNTMRWMLGGEPPEPQKITRPEPVDVDDLRNGDTHTGTDPLGRAIGPNESHLHVKRVRSLDGSKIVKPYDVVTDDTGEQTAKPIDTRGPEARAAKIARATGTRPEADDNPTPLTPAEVATLHGEA